MRFIPTNPVVFVLIIIAFFVTGMLFGKMFGKMLGKTEKFDPDMIDPDMTVGEFNTPKNMAKGPKVLHAVPENRGVVSHDEWCRKFNC
jgi:hypothetical protein